MRVKKRPARRSKTLEEAIVQRQKSYKGKSILYLDTVFSNGIHAKRTVARVIEIDFGYVRWYIANTGMYISDEVTNKLNETGK